MKSVIEAEIVKKGSMEWGGWIEQTVVDVKGNQDFEDVIEKFEGKKVKITIQEIK